MSRPTDRILAAFRSASPSHRVEGRFWYPRALVLSQRLHRQDPRVGAGILAALSPRTPWDRNVHLAERLVAAPDERLPTLRNNARAALRIWGGEDPLDVLRSPKVRSFYQSILGDPRAVCVDRHAGRVALGWGLDGEEIGRRLARKGVYEAVAEDYRAVAAALGVLPSEVQAVTWLWYRERTDSRPLT